MLDKIYRSNDGVGFPSCNRVLMRVPRNTRDPQGYYRELQVDPWASQEELRTRFRELFKKYHPDGWSSDSTRFDRLVKLSLTLLHEERRRRYDNTPDGKRLLDLLYIEELAAKGADRELLDGIRKEVETPKTQDSWHYDYLAIVPQDFDRWFANEWYRVLVDDLWRYCDYTGVLKIMVFDTKPSFSKDTGILTIPRVLAPTQDNLMYMLRVALAGIHNTAPKVLDSAPSS